MYRVILNKHVLLMLSSHTGYPNMTAGQLVFQTQWLTEVFVAQYGNTVKST